MKVLWKIKLIKKSEMNLTGMIMVSKLFKFMGVASSLLKSFLIFDALLLYFFPFMNATCVA